MTDGVDPAAVLAALGVSDAVVRTRVTSGWDTALWRVERGGESFALRVFRAGEDAKCRYEAGIMAGAAAGGLPVPRIVADGVWQERPALLLTWCSGRPLIDELRARPWSVWAVGRAFGRMLGRVHAVPAPEVATRRGDAWIRWAGNDATDVQAHLRALRPRGDALLHLDYHPLNVMVEHGRVSAVLDWPNAAAGDPRADLARTVTILRLTTDPPDVPPLIGTAVRRLLEMAWWTGYREVSPAVRGLAPFYAWAGAAMVRDLSPKVGRPGVWLTHRDIERMRRWTAHWKRRAGIARTASPA